MCTLRAPKIEQNADVEDIEEHRVPFELVIVLKSGLIDESGRNDGEANELSIDRHGPVTTADGCVDGTEAAPPAHPRSNVISVEGSDKSEKEGALQRRKPELVGEDLSKW
jgi:hypothetical protein